MKIAMIVPSLTIGGAESMVTQLFEELTMQEFNVRIYILSSKLENEFEHRLTKCGVQHKHFNKSIGFSLSTIHSIYKDLDEFDPDIVHSHLSGCIYAIPWVLCKRVKLIHTVHSMPKHELPKSIRLLMNFLYRWNCAIPVAISGIIREEISNLYSLDIEKVEMVYNPVDLNRFSVELKNKDCSLDLVFISVARFTKVKNHEGLVDAFIEVCKVYPKAKLVLVGDGETKREIINKVQESQIEEGVIFTGIKNNIQHELANSDVFVLNSFYEGLPLTILEAMAVGLPIISTGVGGIPDIVKDNGILINSNNTKEMYEAMIFMIENYERRKEMGKISKELSKQYSLKDCTEKYCELYAHYGRKR